MNSFRMTTTKTERSPGPDRNGFTLVELMVVIIVSAILAGLVMAALRGAQQDAYTAKTRATIRKIDVVVQDRYEEYLYAPLESSISAATLPPGFVTTGLPTQSPTTFAAPTGESDAKIHARIRLQLIRDLMRFEMPDCPGDLFTPGNGGFVFRTAPLFRSYYTYNGAPVSVSLADSARYSQIRSAIIQRAVVPGSSPLISAYGGVAFTDLSFLNTNFNAELLFLIVESSFSGGSSGIESFSNSEIADTDGDGLREFIDAWGKPIQWLRWPAGFNEDVQVSQLSNLKGTSSRAFVDRFNPDPSGRYWGLGGETTIGGYDPFDPARADIGYLTGAAEDQPQGALRPLIVSAGLDGQFGLRFLWTGTLTNAPLYTLAQTEMNIAGTPVLWPDPYYPRSVSLPPTVYSPALNRSLGGVLEAEFDRLTTDPATKLSVVTGIQNATSFTTDPESSYEGSDVADVNRIIRESVSDNISNFDETGGSL